MFCFQRLAIFVSIDTGSVFQMHNSLNNFCPMSFIACVSQSCVIVCIFLFFKSTNLQISSQLVLIWVIEGKCLPRVSYESLFPYSSIFKVALMKIPRQINSKFSWKFSPYTSPLFVLRCKVKLLRDSPSFLGDYMDDRTRGPVEPSNHSLHHTPHTCTSGLYRKSVTLIKKKKKKT